MLALSPENSVFVMVTLFNLSHVHEIVVVFKHVNVHYFSQVEAFSLEEPVHLERQTTPQVYSPLEWVPQVHLPPLPTPPLHPSQEHLEVDSASHNPLHSILGMLHLPSFLLIIFGLMCIFWTIQSKNRRVKAPII